MAETPGERFCMLAYRKPGAGKISTIMEEGSS